MGIGPVGPGSLEGYECERECGDDDTNKFLYNLLPPPRPILSARPASRPACFTWGWYHLNIYITKQVQWYFLLYLDGLSLRPARKNLLSY